MIIWISGVSGSGKSTLATEVVSRLKDLGRPVVLLDGDEVREAYGNDLGYDLASRKIANIRISRLCALLDRQGLDVVCPVIANFPEIKDWCRQEFSSFFEVYVKADLQTLKERDPKGFYKKYDSGKLSNFVGLDIPFIEPTHADIVIENNNQIEDFLEYADEILKMVTDN